MSLSSRIMIYSGLCGVAGYGIGRDLPILTLVTGFLLLGGVAGGWFAFDEDEAKAKIGPGGRK